MNIFTVNIVERNGYELNSVVFAFATKEKALARIKMVKKIYRPIIKELDWITDYDLPDGLSAGEEGRFAANSVVINLKQHKI